jgi:hypothetical protein
MAQFEMPADWPQAVRAFWDLGLNESISPAQWDAILGWLVSTRFDNRSYVAGEAAAILVRDRAPPEIRKRLWTSSETADDWLLHCCIIALQHEGHPRYGLLLEKASKSSHDVVRIAGEELLRSYANQSADHP